MANGVPGAPPSPPTVVVPGAGWIDVATRAITQVGFPVVIAGVLLWFVLGKFQTNMELITGRMADNTQTAKTLITAFQAELTELQTQTQELRRQSDSMKEIEASSRRLLELRQQEHDYHPSPGGSP